MGLALKSVALAVAAMVLNVAMAFLWVFLYSTFISPGQVEASYEAYANRIAPLSSVIVGIPILFAAGWLLARWQRGGWRTGICVGIAYVALDAIMLLSFGVLLDYLTIVAWSFSTKLAASALGGALAGRRLANA